MPSRTATCVLSCVIPQVLCVHMFLPPQARSTTPSLRFIIRIIDQFTDITLPMCLHLRIGVTAAGQRWTHNIEHSRAVAFLETQRGIWNPGHSTRDEPRRIIAHVVVEVATGPLSASRTLACNAGLRRRTLQGSAGIARGLPRSPNLVEI